MAKYDKLSPKKRLVKAIGILPNIRVISQETAIRYIKRFGGRYPLQSKTFKVLVRPTGKWTYIA